MNAKLVGFSASSVVHAAFLYLLLQTSQHDFQSEPQTTSVSQILQLSMFNSPVLNAVPTSAETPDREKPPAMDGPSENVITDNHADNFPKRQNADKQIPRKHQPRTQKVRQKPLDKPEKKRPVVKKQKSRPGESTVQAGKKLEPVRDVSVESSSIQADPVVPVDRPEKPAQASSTTRFNEIVDLYKSGVRAEILKNRSFPRQAKRKRLEGTAVVGFRILQDGTVDQLGIVKSSGYDILDGAALKAVQKVRRFDAFPPPIEKPFWDFEIQVSFKRS